MPEDFRKLITIRGASARLVFGLATLLPILVLAGLLIFAPPDGNERAELLQFAGRFHPISVHLPIALLILVLILELAGRTRYFSYVLPAVDFILAVATCGALAATILGWCLARSGGYSGSLVVQHMWGGSLVALAAWSCWVLRTRKTTEHSQRVYMLSLAATVALVGFTGYRGGQLSQGENHLTEFMPEPLASLFGAGGDDAPANSPNGGPNTFFGVRLKPVLAANCGSCHGRSKHKSNLRVDSYEGLMKGGKHGPVIRPGDAKASEILRRVTLPSSDDDAMPPEGRRRLSAAEVKMIEQWIAQGASGTQPPQAFVSPVAGTEAPAVEVKFEEVNPAEVAKQRAYLAQVVAGLQQRFPNVVDYESRGSSNLVVNAAWLGAKFGDSELAALAPASDRIVMADFSNTAITDKSAAAIGGMRNLRSLRLMHTKTGDTTVQALTGLNNLETLSLFDTSATSASLAALSRLPKLQRVYVVGTKINADAAIPPEIRPKLVF